MPLAFSMIPFYLFSNFHCFGMCGPIAALIGRHRFWPLYLAGRIFGFTLLCGASSFFGEVISMELGSLGGYFSIFVGIFMILWCFATVSFSPVRKWSQLIQNLFLRLFEHENPGTAWVIGFATPLLPCGQSLLVFGFCALLANPLAGFLQGFLFSLLTTPSLYLAIKGLHRLGKWKKMADPLLKITVCIVGLLATLRGLAEVEAIDHYTPIPELHLTLW